MKLLVIQLIARLSAKGQTLIEYALIVFLISITVIVVLGLLSGDVNTVFMTIINTFLSATGP
jgi:Flp pilus assembly pilin Flp